MEVTLNCVPLGPEIVNTLWFILAGCFGSVDAVLSLLCVFRGFRLPGCAGSSCWVEPGVQLALVPGVGLLSQSWCW